MLRYINGQTQSAFKTLYRRTSLAWTRDDSNIMDRMKKGDKWEKETCDWLDHTVWGWT